jgi:hypothetical protein
LLCGRRWCDYWLFGLLGRDRFAVRRKINRRLVRVRENGVLSEVGFAWRLRRLLQWLILICWNIADRDPWRALNQLLTHRVHRIDFVRESHGMILNLIDD